jgi:hypothetical protein
VRQRLERQRGRIVDDHGDLADDHGDLADDHGDFATVNADDPCLHAVTKRLDVSAEELGEREPRDDVPHERDTR